MDNDSTDTLLTEIQQLKQCLNESLNKNERLEKKLKKLENQHHNVKNKTDNENSLKSESKFKSFFENSTDIIAVFSYEGKILDINQAGLDFFEYTRDEIYQLDETQIYFDQNDRNVIRQLMEKNGSVNDFEIKVRTKNNNKKIALIHSTPRYDENGVIIEYQSVIHDITEQKKVERKIQYSLKMYQTLFDNSPMGIIITRENKFLFVNKSYIKLLNYQSEYELIEKHLNMVQPPEQAEQIVKRLIAPFNEPTDYEDLILTKDGNEILVHKTETAIELQDGPAALTFVQDITKRNRTEAELQKIREQLFQSQKMEAIGKITGEIAHDFNNLLTLITLNSELLLNKLSPLDEEFEYVKNIYEATKIATGITNKLLLFSRRRIMKPEIVNINEILKNHLSTFNQFIRSNITLEVNLIEHDVLVKIDPIYLEQVFMNLIINAVDAMPKEGKLSISTNRIPKNHIKHNGQFNKEPFVEISISDTGIGMDDTVLEKIFEPFFTTKDEGKGTGLGLATTFSIIQQSNGFIEVQSKLGIGTNMNIYLPLEENITDTKFETPHVHKIALQEEEYILLIDDDVDIRELIKDILTMNGFNVLDTSNPIDALDIFKVNKEKIKLVISDIVMPLLSGPELIEQIQKIKSSINVLYITGYTKEIKSIVNTLKPNMAILQKPFDGNTLVDRISHVMEN